LFNLIINVELLLVIPETCVEKVFVVALYVVGGMIEGAKVIKLMMGVKFCRAVEYMVVPPIFPVLNSGVIELIISIPYFKNYLTFI
jgi:hypothetical protein